MARGDTLRTYYREARRYADARGISLKQARRAPAFQRAYKVGRVGEAIARIEGLKSYWAETRKAAKEAGIKPSDLHGNQHRDTGASSQRWSTDYRVAKRAGTSPSQTFQRDRKREANEWEWSKSDKIKNWNRRAKAWQQEKGYATLNEAKTDPKFKRAYQHFLKASERERAVYRGGTRLQRSQAKEAVLKALLALGAISQEKYDTSPR